MNTHVTAAVVQAGSILFDTPRTIQKLGDLTSRAAAGGAQLVVFPEAFVGGYPKGADFGARLGIRIPERRMEYKRYLDAAVETGGEAFAAICAVARGAGVHLVVGVVEREGGTMFCSVLIVGPDGRLLGKRRKLMPTALERIVWGVGDGSTLDVPQTSLGKVGAAICWENYMPLLRMSLYRKGVEIWCAPTVDDRDTWPSLMRTIAVEGRCFVLSACQHLTRGDMPADFPADLSLYPDEAGAPVIRGGSCAVGPLGNFLLEPCPPGERIELVELDLAEIALGKFDLDVAGHYARPDVFTLCVNDGSPTAGARRE